jgi:hypothetical protein
LLLALASHVARSRAPLAATAFFARYLSRSQHWGALSGFLSFLERGIY